MKNVDEGVDAPAPAVGPPRWTRHDVGRRSGVSRRAVNDGDRLGRRAIENGGPQVAVAVRNSVDHRDVARPICRGVIGDYADFGNTADRSQQR
jgi:hypothetical protein